MKLKIKKNFNLEKKLNYYKKELMYNPVQAESDPLLYNQSGGADT